MIVIAIQNKNKNRQRKSPIAGIKIILIKGPRKKYKKWMEKKLL